MAPEAFDGKRNERTDIWSVGVILYQMLAGSLPHAQADTASLIGAIVRLDPPPLPHSVPEELRRVVARALERDPARRYASAAEMRRDLRQAVRKAPPPLIPETVVAPAPKRSRAMVWGLALGAAGLLLFVVFGAAAALYLSGSSRESSPQQAAAVEQGSKVTVNQTADVRPTATPTPSPSPAKDERADLRRWLGMLSRSDQVKQVLKETSAALAADPGDAFALRARSAAYDLSLNVARGKQDAAQAERLLANPARAEEFEARCYSRLDLEKLDDALGDCARAVGLDPQYAWAWCTRGGVYLEKDDPDDALNNFNRALELDPRNTLAHLLRGFIFIKKGDFDSALDDFNRAIELDPRNVWAYMSRGKAEEGKDDYDTAIADYTRAIELDPRFEEAYKQRSELYRKTDRDDLADADARTAQQLHQQGSQK
jgi:Flp pilus assembly protein TadD